MPNFELYLSLDSLYKAENYIKRIIEKYGNVLEVSFYDGEVVERDAWSYTQRRFWTFNPRTRDSTSICFYVPHEGTLPDCNAEVEVAGWEKYILAAMMGVIPYHYTSEQTLLIGEREFDGARYGFGLYSRVLKKMRWVPSPHFRHGQLVYTMAELLKPANIEDIYEDVFAGW